MIHPSSLADLKIHLSILLKLFSKPPEAMMWEYIFVLQNAIIFTSTGIAVGQPRRPRAEYAVNLLGADLEEGIPCPEMIKEPEELCPQNSQIHQAAFICGQWEKYLFTMNLNATT